MVLLAQQERQSSVTLYVSKVTLLKVSFVSGSHIMSFIILVLVTCLVPVGYWIAVTSSRPTLLNVNKSLRTSL